MKLPKLENNDKYVGLYVFDFGDHAGVGFTAKEVAELLDSEQYRNCKVYKIHKAYPDGTIELKGVQPQNFQLESGMFFYSDSLEAAKKDFKKLVSVSVSNAPPCRANVQLAKYADDKFIVTIIYPAEYEDQISSWLLDCSYRTAGQVVGGIGAVQEYYNDKPEIIEKRQLFEKEPFQSRTGLELLANLKAVVQR